VRRPTTGPLRVVAAGSRPVAAAICTRPLGVDVYPDRAAWLVARHAWEAGHGMTAGQWFDAA
jgi:hypothetical protein